MARRLILQRNWPPGSCQRTGCRGNGQRILSKLAKDSAPGTSGPVLPEKLCDLFQHPGYAGRDVCLLGKTQAKIFREMTRGVPHAGPNRNAKTRSDHDRGIENPNGSSRKATASKRGDVLFTLETEKVTYEVESPADGVLAKILIREGETVPSGPSSGISPTPGRNCPWHCPPKPSQSTGNGRRRVQRPPGMNLP